VDELMALCDQLESQQKERNTRQAALVSASLSRFADAPTPENLNYIFHKSYDITPAELRKTILTLAVQGKLVPQDPSDEPAEELVARVATEKLRLFQAKEIKSETHLDPISDEEVFPIPASWIWRRAGDLCRPISSGSTPDQRVFHPSEGIPYLKVYNIRNQTVDFDYKRQFIAVNHHKERMKRSILRPGDVIMNIVGPPLGKVAVVPHTYPEWNCNQAISFFRPIFPELAPYLYTYLKEGSFLQNIQLIGTAGQDNISVTKCKFIPVPLPPLAEQRRIVAKVEELMKLVDELEAQIAMSRDSAVKLLDAIVHEFTSR
jgi:type I restriction enzyme S subunit